MRIKPGADIKGLDLSMRPALIEADKVWDDFGKELVVTCGLDGEHSAGSLHYYGRAVDLRTRYFSRSEVQEVRDELQNRLGVSYQVVDEGTHIHVEYDPG